MTKFTSEEQGSGPLIFDVTGLLVNTGVRRGNQGSKGRPRLCA